MNLEKSTVICRGTLCGTDAERDPTRFPDRTLISLGLETLSQCRGLSRRRHRLQLAGCSADMTELPSCGPVKKSRDLVGLVSVPSDVIGRR